MYGLDEIQFSPFSACSRGPFKYYVIMFLTFLGPPTHLFDDLQYCKSSKIAIFLTPPTHLFDDVILEWFLRLYILGSTIFATILLVVWFTAKFVTRSYFS